MKIQTYVMLFALAVASTASAQVIRAPGTVPEGEYSGWNFSGRRALIVDICPSLRITAFKFGNTSHETGDRFTCDVFWKNVSTSAQITAFEVVLIKFNPFNEPMIGDRFTFRGTTSGKPLNPGDATTNAFVEYGEDNEAFTCFLYVRAVRFEDGTVWKCKDADVTKSIQAQAPEILQIGDITGKPIIKR